MNGLSRVLGAVRLSLSLLQFLLRLLTLLLCILLATWSRLLIEVLLLLFEGRSGIRLLNVEPLEEVLWENHDHLLLKTTEQIQSNGHRLSLLGHRPLSDALAVQLLQESGAGLLVTKSADVVQ